MYWLKMCPRCKGDLYEERTRYGPYIACLQCGRSLDARQQKALGVANKNASSSSRKDVFKGS